MKNAINYYYDIVADDIHHHDSEYIFKINNHWFLFLPYYKEIKGLEDIYMFFVDNHLYCHEIIKNNKNEIVTIIDGIPYVLLKEYIHNRKITFNDIMKIDVPIGITKKNNWKQLWCTKLDYYEYQMEQYEQKYPILYEMFSYYDGMTELAICLLNVVENNNIYQYVSHDRISKNNSLRELYNPLNFIIDTKVRDVAEYCKSIFFSGQNPINDLKTYIKENSLLFEESILLLARLLYPSYFFDKYDQIIKGEEEENKINTIKKKVDEYEMFLRNVYEEIKLKHQIPEIDWLKKAVK